MDDLEFKKRVEDKLDKIIDDIGEIKVVQAKQQEQLTYHIKRTDLAEENIAAVRADLKPIQSHVNSVKAITKFILLVGGLIGSIITLLSIFF